MTGDRNRDAEFERIKENNHVILKLVQDIIDNGRPLVCIPLSLLVSSRESMIPHYTLTFASGFFLYPVPVSFPQLVLQLICTHLLWKQDPSFHPAYHTFQVALSHPSALRYSTWPISGPFAWEFFSVSLQNLSLYREREVGENWFHLGCDNPWCPKVFRLNGSCQSSTASISPSLRETLAQPL